LRYYFLIIFSFFFIDVQAQIISNGSFEDASVDPGGIFIVLFNGNTQIDDWIVGGNTIDYVGTFWEASDMDRSIDLCGAAAGSIAQTFTTVNGETYNVQFDIAGNGNCGPVLKTVVVSVAAEVQLFNFLTSGYDPANMGWVTESFDFIATGTSSTITFESLTAGACGPTLDNVIVLLYDCAGTPDGPAEIDECGVCLEPTDPEFNQACADCAGTPNGNAIIDDCGDCLEPVDPGFNQSCADCAGTPNGNAEIDLCGDCLQPSDSSFNQACSDCEGTPNGTAIFDECGVCLEPTDPNINQACIDCEGTPNGTAIIDECGDCLEPTDPNINQSCIDCEGTPNGTAIIDECGDCLESTDPNINQACIDCEGTPNGTAIIDECGDCLESTDPNFNQACIDCDGTPNGTAIIDECGECLDPNDSDFNQSCLDCEGTPNGTAVLDECGLCLEPDDPNFSQSCDVSIYIPNIFSPNSNPPNNLFQLFKGSDNDHLIKTYKIFSRWGGLVYEASNFSFNDNESWWDGTQKGEIVPVGVYVYYIELTFQNGSSKILAGDITVIK
jgi:choice-of-anchor C domain-containing protein